MVVRFIVFLTSATLICRVRISWSVSESPLEFEITRVDCISQSVLTDVLLLSYSWKYCFNYFETNSHQIFVSSYTLMQAITCLIYFVAYKLICCYIKRSVSFIQMDKIIHLIFKTYTTTTTTKWFIGLIHHNLSCPTIPFHRNCLLLPIRIKASRKIKLISFNIV